MARFTPGYVFVTGEAVSPTKFHSMVDSAYLIGVVNSDLVTGVKLPNMSAPGSPATGDVRIASTGLLEFFFGGVWNTQAPDTLQLTLTNKSGSNLVLGDVVVADPANANSFTIAAVNPAPNVIGVLAESIANNASGLVNVRGTCSVRVAFGAAGVASGVPLRGPNGTSGTAAIKVSGAATTDMRSDAFAMTLEPVSFSPTQIITCLLWK